MKNFNRLTRRDLIKSFGLAGVMAVPLLRQTRSFAAEDMQPIYIQLFKPNGNPENSWYPTDDGDNMSFITPAGQGTKVTESFEDFKEYVISPRSVDIYKDGGNAHTEGIARNFTNSTSVEQIHDAFLYKPPLESSIDHIIADYLYERDPSRLRHFHFKYRNDIGYGGLPLDTPSYRLSPGSDRAQPIFAENNLEQMFNTLLARFNTCDGSSGPSPTNPRTSVLDYNMEQIQSLKRRLSFSANETAKLEEYENQIEVIQNNITAITDSERDCPELLMRTEFSNDEGPDRSRTIMDLIVLAVEWELTHTACFTFDSAQGGGHYRDFLDLEVEDNHHGLSHQGVADGRRSFRTVSKYQWDEFAYLLNQLKNKKTLNDQSLLDCHLALVSGGCVSTTSPDGGHQHNNMPYFTVGSAGGAFERTGYTFTPPTDNRMNAHGRLLLSVCHAMGLTHLDRVGDEDKCPGGPMIPVVSA